MDLVWEIEGRRVYQSTRKERRQRHAAPFTVCFSGWSMSYFAAD
jgi:hypothetical protein